VNDDADKATETPQRKPVDRRTWDEIQALVSIQRRIQRGDWKAALSFLVRRYPKRWSLNALRDLHAPPKRTPRLRPSAEEVTRESSPPAP
jgi:uncharacterized protein RhaS with RHS repeats